MVILFFLVFGNRELNVARGGFEPPHTGPKPAVLPLDDRAISSKLLQTPNLWNVHC